LLELLDLHLQLFLALLQALQLRRWLPLAARDQEGRAGQGRQGATDGQGVK
jgi:hypothetical protein